LLIESGILDIPDSINNEVFHFQVYDTINNGFGSDNIQARAAYKAYFEYIERKTVRTISKSSNGFAAHSNKKSALQAAKREINMLLSGQRIN